MKNDEDWSEELAWHCDGCDVPLQMGSVTVTYMDNSFETQMPCCPECGQVLVPEGLAVGKMAEVERILEDK